ncbi:TetR/AcrR family transcriptional regulator [Amycolatopsis thailandensis]|uniref:TetR/AcrR family transcriptional regulator n=1 Tax=Amycolatopsis thailandensis TaxID=589330 RepID=UPI0036455571
MVDAAARLTVRQGIDEWTIRALAQELGVAQAVIYHHVGGRSQIVRAVVERVVAQIPLPAPDLQWREWFGTFLTDVRRVALHYPGVARHLVILGPVAGAGRIIGPGIDVLLEAGFADEAVTIYNYLSNTALSLIAVEDERNKDQEGRLERAREIVDLAHGVDGGLSTMKDWLEVRAENIDQLRASDAYFYRYCVERCLDAAKARLGVVRRRTSRMTESP